MAFIDFKGSELYVEGLQAKELANQYGTPLYVYSKAALSERYSAFEDALKSRKHLSVTLTILLKVSFPQDSFSFVAST